MKKVFYLISIFLPVILYSQVGWKRVISGILNGDTLPGLYSGGQARTKPTFWDVDADGDYDLFIGQWDGTVTFYKNIGTRTRPKFEFVTDTFQNINVRRAMKKGYTALFFVDIDADGDDDLFSGDYEGKVHYYKNFGTPRNPSFLLVDTFYQSWFYRHSVPDFCDIDNDNDYDCFIGGEFGELAFCENIGDSATPRWRVVDEWYLTDGVGGPYHQVSPVTCDIDNDGDYDLFIGRLDGKMTFWRNIGTPDSAVWEHVTNSYKGITAINRSRPTFCDIDGDNDFDVFLGARDGFLRFYKNVGSPTQDTFVLVTEQYVYLDFGLFSVATFCDIDNDNDYDMFVGTEDGNIRFLKNVGLHNWVYETTQYAGIDVGAYSAPTFCDIDNDRDFDLFIGTAEGNIVHYRNDAGTWTHITNNYNAIDVGSNAIPTFADIDGDRDYDLFIGCKDSTIWYYRNDGTVSIPNWTFISENYNNIKLQDYTAPTFGDIDLDNDLDLIIGVGGPDPINSGGFLVYYKNNGTSTSPSWAQPEIMKMVVSRFSVPTLVDIDKDNDLDLFVCEADGGINLWINTLIGVKEDEKYKITKIKIYPNPCYNTTEISFVLDKTSDVTIELYNLTGTKIRTIHKGKITPGLHKFDIKNLTEGIYFCIFNIDGIRISEKIIKL